VLDARHRDVEPTLIVEAAERDLVEAIEIDDEIELLANGQEVRQHEQMLRLLVPLVAEAERHQLLVSEDLAPLEILDEPVRADLAEPQTH